MDYIVLEQGKGLREAILFANCQFGVNYASFQPKIYCHESAGRTYSVRRDGKIVGMLSVYPNQYRDLKCLSVGTVCTAQQYRGEGIMCRLFAFLQEYEFPHYDIIVLCGKKTRYEFFGFAKALWFPEYLFYPAKCTGGITYTLATKKDALLLSNLWNVYGTGVTRNSDAIFDILHSASHEVYLLSDGKQSGYVCGRRGKRILTEYCGPWPAEMVISAISKQWGSEKIGMMGAYNRHDDDLLRRCDSYIIRNHGNVRFGKGSLNLQDVYDGFGHGGKTPDIELPSSLIYLDGI